MEMWPTRDKENLRCHWHWNPGPLNCFRVLALTRGDIIAIPVLKYSTYLQWEYTVCIPEKMSIRPNWYRMVVPVKYWWGRYSGVLGAAFHRLKITWSYVRVILVTFDTSIW